MVAPRVYVVVLNWNGWPDTLECLESILRSDYPNFRIVVCDNNSSDGSLDHVRSWAVGACDAKLTTFPLCGESLPLPVQKPLRYATYNQSEAAVGGDMALDPLLVLVQSEQNLGYAGGNNLAVRYALARGDCSYVWLLNNDTVVCKTALRELVARVHEDSRIGICGSTLCYYDAPNLIQALGGASYNKWLGIAKNIGYLTSPESPVDESEVESKLDYVIGASMLITRECFASIGLLNEGYFLYFEELDLAARASGNFRLAYSRHSVVFHKESASIAPKAKASSSQRYRAAYLLARNTIRFTRTFHPIALPTICLGLLITFCVRVIRGEWDRATAVLSALRSMGY